MFTSPLTIDFSTAPSDPVERLMWLSGAREVFDAQLSAEYQKAYFDARRTGRLDAALSLGLHSRKRVMALTRHENEARGRMIKWRDGH